MELKIYIHKSEKFLHQELFPLRNLNNLAKWELKFENIKNLNFIGK